MYYVYIIFSNKTMANSKEAKARIKINKLLEPSLLVA